VVMEPMEVESPSHSRAAIFEVSSSFYRKLTLAQKIWILVIFSIILITGIALIISAFSYIEWNEYGLKVDTATNKVDYTVIYDNGRYFWGVGQGVVTFVNTATTVDFSGDNDLSIFSEGGLELEIDCSFQYRVIKEELSTLYKNYGTSYPEQIVSIAKSVLKNVAPNFTMEQYYQDREAISAQMFEALKAGLRIEMNVEVLMFQLRYVTLPNVVIQKLLSIGVQNQTNIREQYIQQSTVIRQQTASLANSIIANATVINETANAQASFITSKAQAQAFKLVQLAKQQGYAKIFQALGLNTPELQLSFLYVTSMQQQSNVHYLVNLNGQVIVQQ